MYKYCLYGKERHIDTHWHPISIHNTKIGAYIAMLTACRKYEHLNIKP